MKKARTAMAAAAAMVLSGVAGAQTARSTVARDVKYQLMKCWRPAPGSTVKCIVEVSMIPEARNPNSTFASSTRASVTTSDGKTWPATAVNFNGNTFTGDDLQLSKSVKLTQGVPVSVQYTFNIPQTYSEVRVFGIKSIGLDIGIGSVAITTADTAAVVSITPPATVPAGATVTLTGCKVTAPNTLSCSGIK